MKIDTQAIGAALLKEFKTHSEFRRIEQGLDHGYAYKPSYRCLACLCSMDEFKDLLGGRLATLTEAEEILRATHPFFVGYLDDPDHHAHFVGLHQSMVDVWRDV